MDLRGRNASLFRLRTEAKLAGFAQRTSCLRESDEV
jgi:hypothetical protein